MRGMKPYALEVNFISKSAPIVSVPDFVLAVYFRYMQEKEKNRIKNQFKIIQDKIRLVHNIDTGDYFYPHKDGLDGN